MQNGRSYMVASDEPKKMSDTLLDYARPLLYRLPHDHTFDEWKATIVFAALVWNVGLIDEVGDAVVYLSTKMPPRLRVPATKALAVIRQMLTRKDLCFRGDHRIALAVDVQRDGVKMSVTAIGICTNPDSSVVH